MFGWYAQGSTFFELSKDRNYGPCMTKSGENGFLPKTNLTNFF